MTLAEFKDLKARIERPERRSKSQQAADIAELSAALLPAIHADLLERLLHRWRSEEGPQVVIAEALAEVKKLCS